eukprot:gene12970-biopygen949
MSEREGVVGSPSRPGSGPLEAGPGRLGSGPPHRPGAVPGSRVPCACVVTLAICIVGPARGRPGAARERAAAPPRGRARIPRSVRVRRHARHLHSLEGASGTEFGASGTESGASGTESGASGTES